MSRGYYFTLKIDEELALKIARVNHRPKYLRPTSPFPPTRSVVQEFLVMFQILPMCILYHGIPATNQKPSLR